MMQFTVRPLQPHRVNKDTIPQSQVYFTADCYFVIRTGKAWRKWYTEPFPRHLTYWRIQAAGKLRRHHEDVLHELAGSGLPKAVFRRRKDAVDALEAWLQSREEITI